VFAGRSGDSAFARTETLVGSDSFPPAQSGVALHLPPQSKLPVLKIKPFFQIVPPLLRVKFFA
jgi:hypothetical protein